MGTVQLDRLACQEEELLHRISILQVVSRVLQVTTRSRRSFGSAYLLTAFNLVIFQSQVDFVLPVWFCLGCYRRHLHLAYLSFYLLFMFFSFFNHYRESLLSWSACFLLVHRLLFLFRLNDISLHLKLNCVNFTWAYLYVLASFSLFISLDFFFISLCRNSLTRHRLLFFLVSTNWLMLDLWFISLNRYIT
jgi:hypothetical protein